MSDLPVADYSAELEAAFPLVEPGAKPLGARILVQLRQAKNRATESGIILVEETKSTEKWQNIVGKVIEIGPLAFRKRDTMEPWPEGAWCSVGDYIRIPKWGGDRWEVPISGKDKEFAEFVVINDHEVIAQITGNPLLVKAFV